MQPLDPTPDLPDPQALVSEFDVPGGDGEDMPDEAFAALYPVPSALPTEVACYGVACVEGVPGGRPEAHAGARLPRLRPVALVVEVAAKGRPRGRGGGRPGRPGLARRQPDPLGRGARRCGVRALSGATVAGRYIGGISIKADDVTESEVEYVYPSRCSSRRSR
jgi:hypothetical protein